MQRLFTVATCLFAVTAAAYVYAPPISQLAAISPWSIGVVVGTLMLAVLAGEVCRFLKLPRVVGYAVLALVATPLNMGLLGPFGADSVAFFRLWEAPFAAAAMLTGLSIGLSVNLDTFRQHLRSVLLHTATHVAAVGGAMFAALWGLQSAFAPLTPMQTAPLLIAALLAGTSSPTVIYAVNADLHAEGRFPELQIVLALVKNLVIAAAVAAVIIAIEVGFEPARLDGVALMDAHGQYIGYSAAGGLALGLLLIGVLRFASNQVVFVTLSLAALVAIIWPHAPVTVFASGVLGGIVAGNGSRLGFHLSDALDRSSPFFLSVVLVFAIVETPLPPDSVTWWIAMALVGIRVVAMYVAARTAGALSSYAAGGHFAYSMFSQSLIALFIADAVVLRGQGELGVVANFLPAVVVLDLLVGSVLHRIALVRSGVAVEVRSDETATFLVHHRSPIQSGLATKLDDERSLLPPPELPNPTFRSEKLNRIVERIRQRALRAQDNLARQFFDPRRDYVEHVVAEARERLQEHVFQTFQELRDVTDPTRRRLTIRDRRTALDAELSGLLHTFGPTHEPGKLYDALVDFVHDMERICQVDVHVRAPEEDVTRERDPSDDFSTRLRKTFHAMNTRFGPRPIRTVPVRALASHHLGARLPEYLAPGIHVDGRFRVFTWQRLCNVYHRIDEMYERTLEHLEQDEADLDADVHSPVTFDVEAARRESEELAAFDQRLEELGQELSALDQDSAPALEPLLADEDSVVSDSILTAWGQFVEEFSVDFDDLERDIATFEADVRRRVALALTPAYRAFLADLARAGTYALPARQIDTGSAAGMLDELAEEIAHWRTLARTFVDRRAMLLGFRDLEGHLRVLLDSFVDQVETELCSHLTYYPAEISERCDDVFLALQQTFSAEVSDADLGDAFVQIRRNLSDFLQDEALASVQAMRETNLFGELLREFTDNLAGLVAEQRESYTLVDESYLDRPEDVSARDAEPTEVPFQDVLERHFVQATIASFNELAMRVQNIVDTVASSLGEVNRVTSFNLDAALNELRAEDADHSNRTLIAEFAIGGIRRAGDQATELLETVQAEIDGIDHDILDRTVEHLRSVRRYLFDESMGRLERLAFDVEQDRSALRRQGFEALRQLRASARASLARAARPAQLAADAARDRLMLHETGREELVEDAALATFDTERLMRLPIAYRRLFTPSPVEIPELFVSREEARGRIQSAIDRWNSGRRVSIVITGDLGAGKTSFLHRALADQMTSAKLLRWNVRDRITSEAALASELSKQFGVRRTNTVTRLLGGLRDVKGRRVIVVDGIERLFLRTMAGREALQAFLGLVAQSPPELMWLVTCNETLWAYLQTMLAARDFFTDHIDLRRLERDQIEALIMQRHRVSGYALEFESDEAESFTPRQFAGGQQQRLQKRFFDKLFEATDGHPLLALYYWLACSDLSEEAGHLRVAPLKSLRTDHLRRLGDDKLIALGQIVLHEEMSEESFAAVMRTNTDTARRDLAFFESLNLVVREPGRRFQYRINEVLYHDVELALRHRNIV